MPPEEGKIKSRPRIVYLSDTALGITKRLMLKSPEGPIFRNTDGNPWKAYAINYGFSRLKEKLDVKFCLYNFRHSFATRLLQSGVDALTAAILLGHADVSMLGRVYQHLSHSPERCRLEFVTIVREIGQDLVQIPEGLNRTIFREQPSLFTGGNEVALRRLGNRFKDGTPEQIAGVDTEPGPAVLLPVIQIQRLRKQTEDIRQSQAF